MSISYLALGDSYTIGEQVMLHDNFPYQTIQLLRKAQPNQDWQAPEIIAKTGWTTDELSAAMVGYQFRPQYDVVSLLIGVNNQYRGRSVEEFEKEFEALLIRAIQLAGNNAGHVFVLSIPDWGVTPFAEGRDRNEIAQEIDAYNTICVTMAGRYGCGFIDITTSQRADGGDTAFLAADGLHPNGKEYAKWADKLAGLLGH